MNLHQGHRWTTFALVLAVWTAAATSFGNIVYIEYEDINLPGQGAQGAGGPHWWGYVDTLANTLTIETWVEIPGSVEFWTPFWTPDLTVLPLTWPAIKANGDDYDVPNSFNGTIDSTFAFISPVSARNMHWNEGTFNMPAAADFFPGWGGYRGPVLGSNPLVLQNFTDFDQRTMPLLVRDALAVDPSTLATVRVTFGPVVEGVPEASSFLFGLAASGAAAGWGAWRVRRRNDVG